MSKTQTVFTLQCNEEINKSQFKGTSVSIIRLYILNDQRIDVAYSSFVFLFFLFFTQISDFTL